MGVVEPRERGAIWGGTAQGTPRVIVASPRPYLPPPKGWPGLGTPQRGTVPLPSTWVALVANRNSSIHEHDQAVCAQRPLSQELPRPRSTSQRASPECIVTSTSLSRVHRRFLPILTDFYRFSGLSWETPAFNYYHTSSPRKAK